MCGPTLTGDGLELRPLTGADAADHLAGEDDAQLAAFEAPRAAELVDVLAAIERWQLSWREGGLVRNFGIRLDGELVGNVEVRHLGDGMVNLSYTVFPRWRRRGIALRAARLALGYAATAFGADRAHIAALDDNTASLGVIRALGARPTGTELSPSGRVLRTFALDLPLPDDG